MNLLDLFSFVLILLSNFIIYFYNLDINLSVLPVILISTFFEFSIINYKSDNKKETRYLKAFLTGVFAMLKISLSIYYQHYGSYEMFARLGQAKYLAGVSDFLVAQFSLAYLLVICLAFTNAAILLNDSLVDKFIPKSYKDVLIFLGKELQDRKKSIMLSSAVFFLAMVFFNFSLNTIEMYSASLRAVFFNDNSTQAASFDKNNRHSNLLFRNYKHKNDFTGLGKDMNLIVIQVESLQGIFVDKTYRGQEITPNINKLIRKDGSIYFSNYYELLGFGNTADAEYVSLNSLYPNTIAGSYVTYKDTKTFGLPVIADDKGYQTASIHAYDGYFYERNFYHPNIGFKESYFADSFEIDEEIGMGLSDGSFFDQAIPMIKDLDKAGRYFSFLITLTSHIPYDMPKEYARFNLPGKDGYNTCVNKYMDAIHYTDREIANFLDNLDKEGLLDNTVVAIYGDHYAIEINDKAEKHNMTKFLGHEYYYDDMLKIPLIILVPNLDENIWSDQLGSQLDFLPTIMNIMDFNDQVTPMMGVDLLDKDLSKNNVVFPQTHMIKSSYIDDEKIFERSRVPGDQGGFIFKGLEKTRVDESDEISKYGVSLINFSNYLCDQDLLEDEIINFKEKLGLD